jgi:hypothetical protein
MGHPVAEAITRYCRDAAVRQMAIDFAKLPKLLNGGRTK